MEERIKLLEMKVEVLQTTVNNMDKALNVLSQWFMGNKAFMDSIQVKKPEENKLV